MPIKKTTTEGPKAKLMKQTIPALRKKAKALGVSDYTKRTKENLVQSIMLAEARKKRGMGGSKPGRPVTKKTVSRKKVADNKWNFDWQYNEVIDNELPSVGREDQERFYKTRKTPGKQPNERDATRFAKQPGKRVSKSGKTYYEYRANRADISPTMHGPKKLPKYQYILPKYEGQWRGYSNYATWLAVEWLTKDESIIDSFGVELLDGSDLKIAVHNYLHEGTINSHPWVSSIILAYVNTVNWNQVLESLADL